MKVFGSDITGKICPAAVKLRSMNSADAEKMFLYEIHVNSSDSITLFLSPVLFWIYGDVKILGENYDDEAIAGVQRGAEVYGICLNRFSILRSSSDQCHSFEKNHGYPIFRNLCALDDLPDKVKHLDVSEVQFREQNELGTAVKMTVRSSMPNGQKREVRLIDGYDRVFLEPCMTILNRINA